MPDFQQPGVALPNLWLRDWLLISAIASLSLALGLYNPMFALGGLGVLFIALAIDGRVAAVLLPMLVVMPLDLKVSIGSEAAFFDLAYGVFAIPIVRRLLNHRHRVNLLPLILTGFVVMGVATAYYRTEKVSWLLENGLRLEIALVLAVAVASFGRVESIVLATGWSLVPAVSYGMYQVAIDGRGPIYDLFSGKSELGEISTDWTGRPFSTFAHPNSFGFYCAIVTAMLFAVILRSRSRVERHTAVGLALLGTIGMLSTGSRGATMGIAAVLVFLTLAGYLRARYLLIGASLLMVIYWALSAANPTGLSHASEFGDETVGTRMQLWRGALLMFLQNPLIGVGWKNYEEVLNTYIDWRSPPTDHAHNVYLSFLAEGGVVGFALFFMPIIAVLVRAYRRCRTSTAALAGFSGLLVYLVHGTVDVIWAPQAILVFGVAFGLACRDI